MKPASLILDTRDDRTQMHKLLERLPSKDRLAWLAWCCKLVKGPYDGKVRVAQRSTGQNAMEVFLDFWQLIVQHNLDPTPAAVRLEKMVRGRAYS